MGFGHGYGVGSGNPTTSGARRPTTALILSRSVSAFLLAICLIFLDVYMAIFWSGTDTILFGSCFGSQAGLGGSR